MIEIKDPDGERESLLFDETNLDILDRHGNKIHVGCDIRETINEEFWFNEFISLFDEVNEVVSVIPYVIQKLLEKEKK